MIPPHKPPFYRAYLLRCWEERSSQDRGRRIIRFSLENVRTGWRRGFNSLEDVYAFLQAQLEGRTEEATSATKSSPDCPL